MSVPLIHLNDGHLMPQVGLGTWPLKHDNAAPVIVTAIEAGYRHIDTAQYYENEEAVGEGIRQSGIRREEVFVTTKLRNDRFDRPAEALAESLRRLKMDYVDLFLLHWPVEGKRLAAWATLEKLHHQGLCRAIGVSNFTVRHLTELLACCKVVPAVNQVEFSPYLFQKQLLGFCRSKGIALEAYSPLTRGKRLSEPKLAAIAGKYGKTAAQILVRWALQHDLVILPKSSRKERILENADVIGFEISAGDMAALDAFDENFRTCWDPTDIP